MIHTPIQRGFPGHFIAAKDCCFRLCHDVGPVRVSTVGCYHPRYNMAPAGDEPQDIGHGRKFETYVFRVDVDGPPNSYGIPPISDHSEIDSEGYQTWERAEAGHAVMVAKWAAAS